MSFKHQPLPGNTADVLSRVDANIEHFDWPDLFGVPIPTNSNDSVGQSGYATNMGDSSNMASLGTTVNDGGAAIDDQDKTAWAAVFNINDNVEDQSKLEPSEDLQWNAETFDWDAFMSGLDSSETTEPKGTDAAAAPMATATMPKTEDDVGGPNNHTVCASMFTVDQTTLVHLAAILRGSPVAAAPNNTLPLRSLLYEKDTKFLKLVASIKTAAAVAAAEEEEAFPSGLVSVLHSILGLPPGPCMRCFHAPAEQLTPTQHPKSKTGVS